jgi:hypothetical protein
VKPANSMEGVARGKAAILPDAARWAKREIVTHCLGAIEFSAVSGGVWGVSVARSHGQARAPNIMRLATK